MAIYTGLSSITFTIDGTNYMGFCEDCVTNVRNTLEDSSGANQRFEKPVATKSNWNATGNFKVDDTVPSLLAKAASNDIEVTFSQDTGFETITGTMLIEDVGRSIRNRGIQMVSLTLRGFDTPTIS